MDEAFARPENALEAEELERFALGCARERRSPITRKTMDGHTYHWLESFVTSYIHDEHRPHGSVEWPTPAEADYTALGAYFGRVSARLREGEARRYAAELGKHFVHLGRQVAGWPEPR
jgi:hypothetical protein